LYTISIENIRISLTVIAHSRSTLMKAILSIPAAVCLLISNAEAQTYSVTALTPAPRTRLASAINERGQVVVVGPITPDGVNRGDSYIYFHGQFQDLDHLEMGVVRLEVREAMR
jgi:hypothetical protein